MYAHDTKPTPGFNCGACFGLARCHHRGRIVAAWRQTAHVFASPMLKQHYTCCQGGSGWAPAQGHATAAGGRRMRPKLKRGQLFGRPIEEEAMRQHAIPMACPSAASPIGCWTPLAWSTPSESRGGRNPAKTQAQERFLNDMAPRGRPQVRRPTPPQLLFIPSLKEPCCSWRALKSSKTQALAWFAKVCTSWAAPEPTYTWPIALVVDSKSSSASAKTCFTRVFASPRKHKLRTVGQK